MKITKANKDHECSVCHALIAEGEEYLSETKLSDKQKAFYSFRRCNKCAQRLVDSEISLLSRREKPSDEQIATELSIRFKVFVKKIDGKFQFVR